MVAEIQRAYTFNPLFKLDFTCYYTIANSYFYLPCLLCYPVRGASNHAFQWRKYERG